MLCRSQGYVCLLVACLAACIACAAQHARGDDPPLSVSHQSDWEARIEAALDAQGEWAFEDVPLSDFCDLIHEKLGIDVVLDAKALNDFAIDPSTPITRSIRGISNRSFLRLTLRELNLTYTVQLGALWITTPEKAEALLTTKVYPVGDLLGRDTNLGESRPDYQTLLQAITRNIAPDSWDDVGGPGSLEGIYDALVVRHSSDVHEQVTEFLTAYREIIASEKAANDAQQTVYMLGEDEASAAIRHALDQPFTAEFKDTSLKDVAEFISEKTGIPIAMDVRALEDFGVDTATPISVTFTETPLRFALVRMLNELELTFVIRDEVLLITTPELAEAQLIIGLYPVRDLVEIGDDSSIEPLGVPFDFESLKNVIQSTIAPDTWDEVGGPSSIGHLVPVPTIVIAQTQDAHEQISELLTKLRATKQLEAAQSPAKADIDPAALTVRSYPLYAAYYAPDEIVKLVMRASEPGTWDDQAGTFVQGLGMSIIVNHNVSGHRQVQKLLLQLGVWSPLPRGGKGIGGGGIAVPGANVQPAAPGGGGGFF
jgi:hypothetical protein